MQPEYLTTNEAAAYLRLSPVTLAQWRSRDRGPAFLKLGAAVRYRRADLDTWAERQRVAAGCTHRACNSSPEATDTA